MIDLHGEDLRNVWQDLVPRLQIHFTFFGLALGEKLESFARDVLRMLTALVVLWMLVLKT